MENVDEEKEETPDLNLSLALGLDESEENQDNDHQPLSINNSIVQEEYDGISNEILHTTTTMESINVTDTVDEIEMENVQEILWTTTPHPTSIINVVEESTTSSSSRNPIEGENERSIQQQQIINKGHHLKIDVLNLHCYWCSQSFLDVHSFSSHHYIANDSSLTSMDFHEDLIQIKLEASDGDGIGGAEEQDKPGKNNLYINDDIIITKYIVSNAALRKSSKKKKSKPKRPFECELCGRTFIRKSDAARHKTFSHRKPSQKSSYVEPLIEMTNTSCLQNKDQVDVTCNKCFTTYNSLKEFNEHFYQVKTSTKCKTESTPSSSYSRKGPNGKFISAKSTHAAPNSILKKNYYENIQENTMQQEEKEMDQDENFPPIYPDNDDDFMLPSEQKRLKIETKKKYSTRRQQQGKSGNKNNVEEGNKYCKICDKEFRSVKLYENHVRVNHTKIELELANNAQGYHHKQHNVYYEEEEEETRYSNSELSRLQPKDLLFTPTTTTTTIQNEAQDQTESDAELIAEALEVLQRAEDEEQQQIRKQNNRKNRNRKPFHLVYEQCDDDFSPENSDYAESTSSADSTLNPFPVRKKRNPTWFRKKRVIVPPSERPPPNYRFTCEYCGKSFKEATELKRHDQYNRRAAFYADEVHAEENLKTNPNWYKERFICPYGCGTPPFEFKCQMKMHSQSHRIPGSKPHKCVIPGCPKAFYKIHALKVHMLIHSGQRPFLCSICGRSLASKSAYNFHMRKHELVEKGTPFKCTFPGCTRFFYTKGYLTRHALNHLPEKPFKCLHGTCNRTFRTKGELRIHENIHTGENIFKCPDPNCNKQFRIKLSMKTHMKIHHPSVPAETERKEFKCTHIPIGSTEQCGKIFQNQFSLKGHIKRHEKWEKNPDIPCPHCSKMFRNENNMKQHIKAIHEGVRNFLCPDCGKSFFHNGGFRRHLRIHTGEKPYKCTVEGCFYSCNAPGQLSEHLSAHENKKSFKCSFEDCLYFKKGFNARSSLRRHLLTHSGLKPHKCPYPSCTAAYPESRNLKRHIAKNHYTDQQQQEQVEGVIPLDTRIYIPDPNTMIPEPEIEYQIYYQEEEEEDDDEEGSDDE